MGEGPKKRYQRMLKKIKNPTQTKPASLNRKGEIENRKGKGGK